MKKKETTKKKVKKESGVEMLARMIANGFEKMSAEFRSEIHSLKQGQAKLEQGQEGLRKEVASLKEEQKEIVRHLAAEEKKHTGMLLSLDETVHRNEFNALSRRVEALETS